MPAGPKLDIAGNSWVEQTRFVEQRVLARFHGMVGAQEVEAFTAESLKCLVPVMFCQQRRKNVWVVLFHLVANIENKLEMSIQRPMRANSEERVGVVARLWINIHD